MHHAEAEPEAEAGTVSGSSEDGEDVEEAILHMMEVLELSRSTAYDMLQQHGGDWEAAIMSLMR